MLVAAFGMGMVFVPVNNTALIGVEPANAGVASALINSTQQVGGSIGTALLNTIATTVTASYLHAHLASRGSAAATITSATVHGFAVAFAVAAGVLALALVVVATFINAPVGPDGTPNPGEELDPDGSGELTPGWVSA
jgi:hypothetical protein